MRNDFPAFCCSSLSLLQAAPWGWGTSGNVKGCGTDGLREERKLSPLFVQCPWLIPTLCLFQINCAFRLCACEGTQSWLLQMGTWCHACEAALLLLFNCKWQGECFLPPKNKEKIMPRCNGTIPLCHKLCNFSCAHWFTAICCAGFRSLLLPSNVISYHCTSDHMFWDCHPR